jgi:XTP/dITP diphosphohydrolase
VKLLFATHNDHKVEELNQLLPDSISLISLNDIGCKLEIKETGVTLEENAKIKADYSRMKFGLDCFADDSGLEIEALDGAPGVYSARYGGEERDMDKNIKKVWNELKGNQNTRAWFRTVFYLHFESKEYVFRGRVNGSIIFEKRGAKGFGYDPIFIPKGYQKTFAELGDEVKNKIGHRAIATQSMIKVLGSQTQGSTFPFTSRWIP